MRYVQKSENITQKKKQISDTCRKVGIVSSVSIDHATPACFYAHQPDRNMYYNISLDLSKSGFDYFAGGGFKHPEGDGKIDKSNTNSNVGLGGDRVNGHQKNSLDVAKKLGYTFVNTVKDFNKLKAGDGKVIRTDQDVRELQGDLDRLSDWARKWQMEFNIGKCSILSVGRKDRQAAGEGNEKYIVKRKEGKRE